MSEMVERVARELCERCGVDPDDMAGGTWDGGSYGKGKPAWETWADDARAAIQAMREPTVAMIEAEPDDETDELGHTWDKTNSAAHAKAFWQAMIDAALE